VFASAPKGAPTTLDLNKISIVKPPTPEILDRSMSSPEWKIPA